jgi:di/tricarboxylate transporter
MRRPAPRHVLLEALVAVALGSVVLTHDAFTPSSLTGHRPDVTPPVLLLPSAAAVCHVQAISYPSLGHRLAASAVLLIGGLVATLLIMFLVGCGFCGACSKQGARRRIGGVSFSFSGNAARCREGHVHAQAVLAHLQNVGERGSAPARARRDTAPEEGGAEG